MKNLSNKAKAIYDLLRNRPTAQDKNGIYCTYPIKELANSSNISIMTVRRILKELEKQNYISCKSCGNTAQRIYFEHSTNRDEHSKPENEHSTNRDEHSKPENEHSTNRDEHSKPENNGRSRVER